MKRRTILFVLLSLLVIVIDVVVVVGWFLSVVYLIAGIALIVSRWRVYALARKVKIAAAVFTVVIVCALLGHGVDISVMKDISEYRANVSSAYPENKSEFVKARELSWISRMSILAYSNVGGVATVRFRVFPYRLVDYDLNTGKIFDRPYD